MAKDLFSWGSSGRISMIAPLRVIAESDGVPCNHKKHASPKRFQTRKPQYLRFRVNRIEISYKMRPLPSFSQQMWFWYFEGYHFPKGSKVPYGRRRHSSLLLRRLGEGRRRPRCICATLLRWAGVLWWYIYIYKYVYLIYCIYISHEKFKMTLNNSKVFFS